MRITLDINRVKRGNEIWETFTVSPNNSFIKNPKRAIFNILWFLRNHYSIGDKFPLKRILEFPDRVIYVYDIVELHNVDLHCSINLNYFPVLGTKTCKVCRNECVIQGEAYCYLKGKKLDKHSHYKCREWSEKFLYSRRGGNVYKQGRPATY